MQRQKVNEAENIVLRVQNTTTIERPMVVETNFEKTMQRSWFTLEDVCFRFVELIAVDRQRSEAKMKKF